MLYQTSHKQYKVQIDRVSVKEREEFSSLLSIEGRINGISYTATAMVREGRDEPDGEIVMSLGNYKISDTDRQDLLEVMLTLLDEHEDSTMQREMSRILD